MSNPIPSTLGLTSIPDGASIVASDHRNNYAAIQAADNAIIAALSGGTAGQLLQAVDATHVQWAYPPGFEIVEAQVATDAANSTVGSDTTLVTFPAATFEAVKYYLEIAIPAFKSNSPGATTTFKLREATVQVGASLLTDDVSGANRYPLFYRLAFTPSAGLHTFNVSWQPSAGTSTIVATGAAPAEFRIVKA